MRIRHIYGEPACGQAVLVELADGAEIRGAEKSDPVVLVPIEFSVAILLQAEPGETRPFGQAARDRVGRHVEIIRAIDNFPRLVMFDGVHFYRLLKEHAEVEKGGGEVAGALRSQRCLGTKAYLPMRGIVDLRGDVGRGARRGGIVHGCQHACALLERVERKRLSRSEAQR